MILASLIMDFAPDKVDEVLQILRSIVESTRVQAGCVFCSVYQDIETENQIFFVQKWKSDEDLQRHLGSEEYQKVLMVLEMALKHPEIRFDIISSCTGIETIEKARSQAR